MKTYDRVKLILQEKPETRNCDKTLIWEFYKETGRVEVLTNVFGHNVESIAKSVFIDKKIESTESIRRCRATIQSKFEELQPTSNDVRKKRRMKELTKGTFIFREDLKNNKYI